MIPTAPNSFPAQAVRERKETHGIVARLCPRFPERRAEDVERAVERAYGAFQHSPIRDFIPILVERLAREDLQNL